VEEIKNLHKELSKTKYSQDGFQSAVRVVFDYLANPAEQWETGIYARQRLLLSMLFEQKLVYRPYLGFQTAEIPFMHAIFGTKIMSKIHLVDIVQKSLNQIEDWVMENYVLLKSLSMSEIL
jgi:hypothetical protein